MFYIESVRQPQKPTKVDNNFFPGPRGAQRITGQASRRAGQKEKCPFSAHADSFPSGLCLNKTIGNKHLGPTLSPSILI